MKVILLLLRSSWIKIGIGILSGLAAGVFYALSIQAIHSLIASDEIQMTLFLKLVGMVTTSSLLSVFSTAFLVKIYESKVSDIRLSLCEKILESEYELIEQNSNKLIPILDGDLNTIGQQIKKIPDAIVAASKIVACSVYMIWLSWQFALIVLIIVGVIFATNALVLPLTHKLERKTRGHKNHLFEHIQGLIIGIKELTLNQTHRDNYVDGIIGPVSRDLGKNMSKLGTLNVKIIKSIEWLVVIALAGIILFFQANSIINQELLIQMLTLVLFLLPAVISVSSFIRTLKKLDVAFEQINGLGVLLGDAPKQPQGETSITESEKGSIELRDISFSYQDPSSNYEIGPINLSINPSEVTFLVGGNGSGKTTLSKIITGLYQPSAGELVYRNRSINDQNRQAYRNKISALFVDSFLFQDLSYLPTDKLATAQSTIEELQIEDKISIENRKLSNVNLSYGQQGRLSLLRAMLEDKEIYLFDEWAANQDLHFKEKFYLEIVPSLKKAGKTVIVISHNEKYFNTADRIIYLSNGQVEKITD